MCVCVCVYQFSSVAQLCVTLYDPVDCSTPGLPVHHQFPEIAQTHVHWVGDVIQPSHPLYIYLSIYLYISIYNRASWWLSGKESVCIVGDTGGMNSIPGLRSNPLQYSCLENPMDRGLLRATVHRVAESRTWLKWWSTHTFIYIHTETHTCTYIYI